MHAMTSETVAQHTRPILEEVRQLAEMVRGLAKAGAERDRKLDELAKAVATHDRKLDVLAAQMRLVIGAFGLLITALIAVFGILFTR